MIHLFHVVTHNTARSLECFSTPQEDLPPERHHQEMLVRCCVAPRDLTASIDVCVVIVGIHFKSASNAGTLLRGHPVSQVTARRGLTCKSMNNTHLFACTFNLLHAAP